MTMVEDGERAAAKRSAVRQGWAAACAACLMTLASTPVSTAGAASVEREGMRFDDSVRLGGERIVANGIGVRSVAWFKGYVAVLYLPRKQTDAEQVYASPGPKRIAVRMLLDVNAAVLAKTFADGIRKNYDDEAIAGLRERMDAFDAEVRATGGVKKGDEIDLDYRPDTGTQLVVNGASRGEPVRGDDFYVALLKMFIGPRAVDKNLRAALLGQPEAQAPEVQTHIRDR